MALSWHIFVVKLKSENLSNRWVRRIQTQNPNGRPGADYLQIKPLGSKKKVTLVRNREFTSFPRPFKWSEAIVSEHSETPNNKLCALRICRQFKHELQRAGNWVWYPEEKKYRVYAIRLNSEVSDNAAFKAANSDRHSFHGYFYIGQTGKTIEQRYATHLAKRPDGTPVAQSNRYVRKFHLGIAEEYRRADLDNLTELESLEKEAELGQQLRDQGFATWWG